MRFTAIIVSSPKSIPAIAPFAFARAFHMPSRKTPSIAPYVIEAIVNPATSTGPQRTSPRLPSTTPQIKVIHRERFKSSLEELRRISRRICRTAARPSAASKIHDAR